MVLLYTGANTPNAPQINAEKSLGGYVSSTGVPNGRLSNLFGTITKSDVQKIAQVIRMIALKNTTPATVSNVQIYSTVAGKHVKLKLAAVAPAYDANNNPVFESVLDGATLPYQAVLNYQEGQDNAIQAGDLESGKAIGIWILREIDITKFPEFTTEATGKELADILEAAVMQAEEEVVLSISYT